MRLGFVFFLPRFWQEGVEVRSPSLSSKVAVLQKLNTSRDSRQPGTSCGEDALFLLMLEPSQPPSRWGSWPLSRGVGRQQPSGGRGAMGSHRSVVSYPPCADAQAAG